MEKVKQFFKDQLHWFIVGGVALLCALFLTLGTPDDDGYITVGGKVTIDESTTQFINDARKAIITYAETAVPAVIVNSEGEEETIDVPTVESIDGGLLEDSETGFSPNEESYADLGWAETYDTSSPQAFKNDTLDKCIYAGNIYGAQCVSLARVFWWSYANRDVSTCGTGMAKGMMNCAEQNAGDDFYIYWADSKNQIQAGDWIIFDGGQYGHVGMALGPVTNGYVALLGENQAGKACEKGGAATNIINANTSQIIGFYRPKTYVEPEPEPIPSPTPITPKSGDTLEYSYKPGDYFSKVLVKLGIDEGNLWGDQGTVKFYTGQLIEQNMLDAKGNVLLYTPFKLTVR